MKFVDIKNDVAFRKIFGNENLEVIPNDINDEGLQFAYQDVDKHNWTKEELEAYDYVLMREQDDRGRWSLALRREKEEIAKKIIKAGLPLTDIAEITGLTIEQIQKLSEG